MDRIDSMGVFARVVAKQSFSAAARDLRLSQAAVSKHVRALEDWLGARLLDRTTRRLNVTEIGALVYDRCERILDEIDEVQQSTSALQTAPRGVLHLAAPLSFGITQLGPALADYLSRYPEVVVDATLDDRFVDLVEEGFDLALRIGSLKDSSLIARRLASVRFVLCASTGYVKQHGAPRQPDDLASHRCLSTVCARFRGSGASWGRRARLPCESTDVSAPTAATCCMRRCSRAQASASCRLLLRARILQRGVWYH